MNYQIKEKVDINFIRDDIYTVTDREHFDLDLKPIVN